MDANAVDRRIGDAPNALYRRRVAASLRRVANAGGSWERLTSVSDRLDQPASGGVAYVEDPRGKYRKAEAGQMMTGGPFAFQSPKTYRRVDLSPAQVAAALAARDTLRGAQ